MQATVKEPKAKEQWQHRKGKPCTIEMIIQHYNYEKTERQTFYMNGHVVMSQCDIQRGDRCVVYSSHGQWSIRTMDNFMARFVKV